MVGGITNVIVSNADKIKASLPSPNATTPGGAYDERYVRTFQEYNEFMKQYADDVGNMTEEQYEAILKAADELDARGQMDYKEAAGVIQRKNGKLGLFKQGLVLSENYNSVTFSKNVEGEAIMHSHGKYCTASYRMGPGYDYNNKFSPMDTQTFIQLEDKVTYDVLIGSNGSVWVREKYDTGRSYQVTPAFELAGPKREK